MLFHKRFLSFSSLSPLPVFLLCLHFPLHFTYLTCAFLSFSCALSALHFLLLTLTLPLLTYTLPVSQAFPVSHAYLLHTVCLEWFPLSHAYSVFTSRVCFPYRFCVVSLSCVLFPLILGICSLSHLHTVPFLLHACLLFLLLVLPLCCAPSSFCHALSLFLACEGLPSVLRMFSLLHAVSCCHGLFMSSPAISPLVHSLLPSPSHFLMLFLAFFPFLTCYSSSACFSSLVHPISISFVCFPSCLLVLSLACFSLSHTFPL